MKLLRTLSVMACMLGSVSACGSDDDDASNPGKPLSSSTVLDLEDVSSNPDSYEWFDFRPNIKKLILAGAAETKHIAILWYTVTDGGVALHYHSKTESVYVIDGTQTDDKGVYPTGTAYFNPPGSGHQVTDSTGFFILAYASPPDFTATDMIEEYTPVTIDTTSGDLMSDYPFEEVESGGQVYEVPLDGGGGLAAQLIELSEEQSYDYEGNYVLVLEGSCGIDGVTLGKNTLVVSKAVETQPYQVSATAGKTCLAMAVSF